MEFFLAAIEDLVREGGLSAIFTGFYLALAILCAVILLLTPGMRGFTRGFAFASVIACVLFGGAVASLSLLVAVPAPSADLPRKKTFVAPAPRVPETPDPTEDALAIIRSMQKAREEGLASPGYPVADPTAPALAVGKEEEVAPAPERWDDEGNLVEDDLSHERSYPEENQ